MKKLRAERLLSVIRTASSMPILVATAEGEYIVKLRGAGQGLRALVAEVVVAELAEQVGLRVPSRAVIEAHLTHDDPEIAELLAKSRGDNLGFVYLEGASVPATVEPELASRIVVFDTLVMNVDRRAKNPNLLVHNKDIYLIDHGAVLLFEHTVHDSLNERVLFDHVLTRFATDIPRQSARMRMMLDRPQIARAVGAVPSGWLTDEERRAMVDLIAARVAAWPEWSARIGIGQVSEGGREAQRIRGTAELLGEAIDLAARGGLRDVRVEHVRLRPGRRASSPHFHTRSEELVYVLHGAPTLVLDGEARPLRPGDYVGFPAGVARTHYVVNHTENDVEYLVVATLPGGDETKY